MFSDQPLPPCDILVAADVLYNPELAAQVGRRLFEAISRSGNEDDDDSSKPPLKVIITDSQKFHGTDFLVEAKELVELNSILEECGLELLQWETRQLKDVCGSGVLIDEDQTYDIDVRMIRWGWTPMAEKDA